MKKMPPLYHREPDQEYETSNSEVYEWMRQQEDIMHWLMMKAKDAGLIRYDPFLKMWIGTEQLENQHAK